MVILWAFIIGHWSFRCCAGNLLVDVHSFTSANIVNRRITLTLLDPGPITAGPWLIAGDSVAQFTDTNGQTIFTNVLAGGYRLDIAGTPSRSFPFGMPDTNTIPSGVTTNVVGLIGATNIMPWFYTAAQLDAILATNYGTAAGTNVTVQTNVHQYTVNVPIDPVTMTTNANGIAINTNGPLNIGALTNWGPLYFQSGINDGANATKVYGVGSGTIDLRFPGEGFDACSLGATLFSLGVEALLAGPSNVSTGPFYLLGSSNLAPNEVFGPNNLVIGSMLTSGGRVDTNAFDGATYAWLNTMVQTNDTRSVKLTNTANQFAGSITTATNGFLHMSPGGGNNPLLDMFTATNSTDQQVGLAAAGAGGPTMWFGRFGNGGIGTNGWGYSVDFVGGVGNFGNPYWYDIPNGSAFYSSTMTFMGGPTASRLTSAYAGGNTNGATVQPVFNIYNNSAFNGGGGINISSAFTNSSRGGVIGTNSDGVIMYRAPFGIQLIEIGDAYNVSRSNANPLIGGEAQQSGCDVLIMNGLVFYASENGQRTGDSMNGQVPLMVLNPTSLNHPKFRIPLQVPNVWKDTNANWQDSVYVDEGTGQVTNFGGIVIGYQGVLTLGPNQPSGDYGAGVNLNTNVSINNPNASQALALMTWDGIQTRRLGVVEQSGQYTKHAHGNGTPWIVAEFTGSSDLRAAAAGAEVDELYVDANHNLTITNGNLSVNGSITAVSPSGFLGGIATLSTNKYTMASTGYTNSNNKTVRLLNFTGTSVNFTNLSSKTAVALGTITTPAFLTLQSNECVVGSSCTGTILDF